MHGRHLTSSKQDTLYVEYDSSLRRAGVARVNEESPTRACTDGISHACLYFYSIIAYWPLLIYRSAEGRRLSWPWRVITYRGGFTTVIHPSINRA